VVVGADEPEALDGGWLDDDWLDDGWLDVGLDVPHALATITTSPTRATPTGLNEPLTRRLMPLETSATADRFPSLRERGHTLGGSG